MLHVLEILYFVVLALLVHRLHRFVYFHRPVLQAAVHHELVVHVLQAAAHQVRQVEAARQAHLEQAVHHPVLRAVHQVQAEAHQAEAALLHVQVIVLH